LKNFVKSYKELEDLLPKENYKWKTFFYQH
jgi:hypothetical protein